MPAGTLAALNANGVTVTGSGSGTLVLTGSIADINAFIAASRVSYLSAPNANGDVTLTATVNDLGNTGSGGASPPATRSSCASRRSTTRPSSPCRPASA